MNGNMNLGKRVSALEKDGGADIKKEISDLQASVSEIQTSVSTVQEEITNLENKVNHVIWERDYIDHALEDSLKQY